MKLTSTLAIALVCGSVGVASAEMPLETPWTKPKATYVPIAPAFENHVAHADPNFSNIIYLESCKPNGCMIRPGGNNSTANPPISSIPSAPSTVQPFAYTDAVWAQVVDCVRKTYGPFGVQVTDQKPTSGPFHLAIVAGIPQDIGFGNGIGGVAPFSCGYIPNAVSFSFANVYNGSVDDICWTVAQETAHAWGLDHKFDNRDPMTYLETGPSRKTFQNEAGPCGEFQARPCMCTNGATMNSWEMITATFGSSTPTPPIVGITSPAEGEAVASGFPVRANITDDIGVTKAELRIDGTLVSTLTKEPYVWNAPLSLGQGRHRVRVTAYDVSNTPGSLQVKVTLGKVCSGADDCDKATDTCVDGRCAPGPEATGGLGTECTINSECASGQCGADGGGNHYCVEQCDPAEKGCPSGFTCLPSADDSGVCWPGGDSGSCSAGSSGAPGFLLFGAAVLFVSLRRRRRS